MDTISGHLLRLGWHRRRAFHSDQLGPDPMPVVRPQIPTADHACALTFDTRRQNRRAGLVAARDVAQVPDRGLAPSRKWFTRLRRQGSDECSKMHAEQNTPFGGFWSTPFGEFTNWCIPDAIRS